MKEIKKLIEKQMPFGIGATKPNVKHTQIFGHVEYFVFYPKDNAIGYIRKHDKQCFAVFDLKKENKNWFLKNLHLFNRVMSDEHGMIYIPKNYVGIENYINKETI